MPRLLHSKKPESAGDMLKRGSVRLGENGPTSSWDGVLVQVSPILKQLLGALGSRASESCTFMARRREAVVPEELRAC